MLKKAWKLRQQASTKAEGQEETQQTHHFNRAGAWETRTSRGGRRGSYNNQNRAGTCDKGKQ